MDEQDIRRLGRTRDSIRAELRRRREAIERNRLEEARLEAELKALDAALDLNTTSKRVRLHIARVISKGRAMKMAPRGCPA